MLPQYVKIGVGRTHGETKPNPQGSHPCDTRRVNPDQVRLFLVRHGEVDANRSFRYLGRRDDPLNATGREQAGDLARCLSDVSFDAVLSSPLLRTIETARAIAEPHGLTVECDDRLIELDFGEWEGRTRAEVTRTEKGRLDVERWENDPTRRATGGESFDMVRQRVTELADGMARDVPGSTVVVVSHMGPIKTLLCAALGISMGSGRRIFLDPATISVVDWGDRPVVRLVNSHAHLGFGNARWMARP